MKQLISYWLGLFIGDLIFEQMVLQDVEKKEKALV
jgi:hypothetical protein